MAWIPLSDRLDQLPLILAGPILRRTELAAVTVWVALKEACEVSLKIHATQRQGWTIGPVIMASSRATVQLGQSLHIVAVTASLSTPLSPQKSSSTRTQTDRQPLEPGQIYAYDLSFKPCNSELRESDRTLEQALASSSPSAAPNRISYFNHGLPTFALPPDDLNSLRIVHGSCRKLHGGGRDALAILDNLIERDADLANVRPHQLFLAGDQIYGDEVADALLMYLTDAGDTLLGWEEQLPLRSSTLQPSNSGGSYPKPKDLKPGRRAQFAEDEGGLTAGLQDQPECAKSHLLSFGEYCSSYLFSWSPTLWSEHFFPGKQIHQNAKQAKQWDQEVHALQELRQELWKVRRALANIPTYMIFDDHDISDDWYLNRAWCDRVLSKPMGRRLVQNGLLAYAIFQGWGNTPEQFEIGQMGEKLLAAAEAWSASAGTNTTAAEAIARYTGIPAQDAETGLPRLRLDENVLVLDRDPLTLTWNYTIRSHKHEVLVLDTRTWRGYPAQSSATDPPMLLSPTAFDQQIRVPLKLTDQLKQAGQSDIEMTLAIAPTNLINLQVIDLVQKRDLKQGKIFHNDVGDAWNLNQVAFAKLLGALLERRERIVVLSGDIHYGYATRLNYWSRCDPDAPAGLDAPEKPHVLVQLTASAFKNAEWKTQLIHTKIKSLALEQPQDWVGWNSPPKLIEILVMQGLVKMLELDVLGEGPIVKQVRPTHGNPDISWAIAVKDKQFLPDWRYRIEWIRRERSQIAFRKDKNLPTVRSQSNKNQASWLQALRNGVSLIWRNRWLQEGEEVVGHNNLGLVSFRWSQHQDEPKIVIQDLYWYAPWKPGQIVFSRYSAPLSLAEPPPPLPVLNSVSTSAQVKP